MTAINYLLIFAALHPLCKVIILQLMLIIPRTKGLPQRCESTELDVVFGNMAMGRHWL